MIIGIGGGDQRKGETKAIDTFALKSTGKTAPRVLCLPTGTRDSPEYAASAEAVFREMGVASFRSLLLTRNPSPKAVDEALVDADLVYLGGGGAPLIAKHGARYNLGERLVRALDRGAVLAGISGGAIALFQGGVGAYNGYQDLPGWGLAPGFVLPHFHPGEESVFGERWFSAHPQDTLFGIEDGAALVWDRGHLRVVRSRSGAEVWQVGLRGGKPWAMAVSGGG